MKKGRVPASVPAEPHLQKQLQDPAFAAAYLSYTAESDDPSDFMVALREVTEVYGGVGAIAGRTRLNRQQLYKTLSVKGNPEFRTLRAILGAAGFSLAIVPRSRRAKRAGAGSRGGKDFVRTRHTAQIESS